MQVTESIGLFGRLGNSIKGIFVGLVLSVVAVVLLVFNERNAVRDIKANKEIGEEVVSVPADQVNPSNEGKLVHLNGPAKTDEMVGNEQFGISENAIRLSWDAEIYQWKERSEQETKKKLGGGEERVTTYKYEKVWSDEPIDSSKFKEKSGHQNATARKFRSGESQASRVTVGAFSLPEELIGRIRRSEPYPLENVPEPLATETASVVEGVFHTGDPANPKIGDERVGFSLTPPGDVSVMAVQSGGSFAPFQTKVGKTRFLLSEGLLSAGEMVAAEEAKAKFLRWALRVIGFVLMSVGFGLVLKPLSVLADVVPFFGNLVGAVTGFVAMMFAAAISLVIIAVSWIFFRPLIGVPLLLVAVAALFFGVKALMSRKGRVATA